MPRSLDLSSSRQPVDPGVAAWANRFHLFRVPTAFGTDSLGLDADNDVPLSDKDLSAVLAGNSDTDEGRLQINMGPDNPHFDFRRPGDPGGAGYYKMQSQFLLLDNQQSGLSMGLQAVTPAGLEAEGVASGPTVLIPTLSYFQDFGDGTTCQGFVGKNLRARSGWAGGLERDLRYGVAVQTPCPGVDCTANRGIHFFIETLGRWRYSGDANQRMFANWDVVPGIHCRLNERWWMAGGFLMPLGAQHFEKDFWHITCSWQF